MARCFKPVNNSIVCYLRPRSWPFTFWPSLGGVTQARSGRLMKVPPMHNLAPPHNYICVTLRARACRCCRMTHQHSSVRCHLMPAIYPSVLGSRGPGLQLYPVTQQQGSVQDQLTPAPFRPCQTCLIISWSLFSGDILQLCQVQLPAASATEHTCRHHMATVRCEGCSSSGVGLLARTCEEKHFEGQSWGHGADWVMRPERMCRPKVGGNVQNTLVTILALHTTKTACTTLSTTPAGQLDGASWFVWAGSNTSMA